MIELYLNGQLAVLEKKTSFKMVFDNPYFTKSSTYTHDINLPLEGCTKNQMIFKHINRGDIRKAPQTLNAIFIADNKVLLNGTAVIREITEERVQVQLLAGNAEMNFFVSGEKYIDELTIPSWGSPIGDWIIDYETDMYFASYPNIGSVWFPVYNETSGEVYNRIAANYHIMNGVWVESLSQYNQSYSRCPQPYLCHIIQQIIQKLGYKMVENQIEDTVFKNLFIANATVSTSMDDILPHWTVNEFFTQLERFLGVVLVVDEGNKSVRLMLTPAFFDDTNPIYINDVVDSFTAKIDDSDTTDLSNANIGFSISGSDYLKYRKLDIESIKNIKVLKYDTYWDLITELSKLDDWNKARRIYEAEGKQYIWVSGDRANLKEVNQFRDLIRNPEKTDLDIELKIVPVALRNIEVEVYAPGTVTSGNLRWKGYVAALSMPGATFVPFQSNDPSVQDIIDGNVPDKYKPDKIEVALNDGLKILYGGGENKHRYPIPFTDCNDNLDGIAQKFPNVSLRLCDAPEVKSLGSEIYSKVKKINTTVEETKRFISKTIYDPKKVFIINNKRYVCQKIEITVTPEEIDSLQEATMYELLD